MKNFEAALTPTIEVVLVGCLFAIAAIVIALVILRYAFNSSITGANEWVRILFVYATALGAALAIGKREHITISVAVERLPHRLQAFSDRVALMLLALLNVVMVLESISWIQITGDYLMPATGLPRIVAQVCVPIGCGIALVYCGLRIWNPAKPAGSADAAG